METAPGVALKAAFLSRFTPSLLSPEALEQMFVQRSRLAERIVDGIRESALTGNKHYYLVTGPRGIGKTHLVSLIYHRLRSDELLRARLRIAWLREEEWGVASYLDLLLVVLRAMGETGEDAELSRQYEELRAVSDPDEARATAERLLIETAGTGTVLIIAENLDEIFRGIEREGQNRLRALLQNHAAFSILGTAQSLFEDVTTRDEPFYGFFDTSQLEELTFESAIDLVARIAEQEGNSVLRGLLASPLGRARMRAAHHLAAGNPRVYVVFSQFLTADSLEDLVKPLLQTLDDLTPYYQGRMAHLSPQQRKIIEYLCDRRGAATVSEIAHSSFIAPQTASSQLGRLADLGYVRSERHGRASYYELREPLLRLTLDVKKLRGKPVRLIVEFLQLWYSERELTYRLTASRVHGERGYYEAALDLKRRKGEDFLVQACRNDLESYVAKGDATRAGMVADELLAVGGSVDDYAKIIGMPGATPEQLARALLAKGVALGALGRSEEELVAYNEVVRRFGERTEESLAAPVAMALVNKGVRLGTLGRSEEAVAVYDEVVRRFGGRSEESLAKQVAKALVNKGFTLGALGRSEDAVDVWEEVVRRFGERTEEPLAEQVAMALVNKGFTLGAQGRSEEAVAIYDEVVGRFADRTEESVAKRVARALVSKGATLGALGRPEDEVAVYDEVVRRFGERAEESLAEQVARALVNSGVALGALARWEEAVAVCDEVVRRFAGHTGESLAEQVAKALINKAVMLGALGRSQDAVAVYDEVVRQFGERAEGSLAEPVARALVAKGATLVSLGRMEEAIAIYDQVLRRFGDRGASLNEPVGEALFYSGLLSGAAGQVDEGWRRIDQAAQRLRAVGSTAATIGASFVVGTLRRTQDEDVWCRTAWFLLEAFERFGQLGRLGVGVVESIRVLATEPTNAELARRWLRVWVDLSGKKQEMQVALRLLRTAVAYLEDRDEATLQALPGEERELLQQVLADNPRSTKAPSAQVADRSHVSESSKKARHK